MKHKQSFNPGVCRTGHSISLKYDLKIELVTSDEHLTLTASSKCGYGTIK